MEKQAIASRDIQESISGIYLIKSFATEKKEFAKIWHSLEQKMNVNVRNGLWGGLAGTVSSMIGSIV
jgi:ABC-type bacteriocin/lantibiotic exporter with double-glycine peptidase domain